MRNDVRRLRTARELSQGALAAALGVSRQTVNAIETGRSLPSLPLAIALARFFGTTVEELFQPEPVGRRAPQRRPARRERRGAAIATRTREEGR